ncbi:hypothetical protein AAH678_01800 [Sodalis endosymbiont of Spalangia cameroni]
MSHAQQKRKQKYHHPPDYPGNLEYIARRIGKRLVEEFRKLKERSEI